MEPIAGDPGVVRLGAEQLLRAADVVAEAVRQVQVVMGLLSVQEGRFNDAAVERLGVMVARGTRQVGV